MAEHGTELLLLATPHDQSREWAPIAIERGIRVIDLSGAWRLQHPTHRGVYKLRDADAASANDLQREAVYGSPELHKQEIAQARLVANPGCYATSIILPLAPLLRAGMADLEYGIICDAKSGVSGAGKGLSPKTHFMYAADNLSAYNVFGHRHTGELVEQLGVPADHIQFTPHLLPIPRGILSTIYLRLREPSSTRDVLEVMRTFFRDAPFVRVRDAGVLPQIQYVTRTNFCDIGLEVGPDGRRVVLISCLDNLLKGAAGQAIQNLNLMYGWGETEGLL
jgi:N-acetyl-gamma-glutamyl-phosphate reductase